MTSRAHCARSLTRSNASASATMERAATGASGSPRREGWKRPAWCASCRPLRNRMRGAQSVDGHDSAVMDSRHALLEVSRCALGKTACEVRVVEICKSCESGTIQDPDSRAGHLDEPILA